MLVGVRELCDGSRSDDWPSRLANRLTKNDANYIIHDRKDVKSKSIINDANCIMITGAQIRAARGLLRWSARELAEKSGVSLPTIQRMESVEGVPSASAKSVDAIERAMERAGVEFIPENGGGDGVRFRKPRKNVESSSS